MSTTQIPQWLLAAGSDKQLKKILRVLDARESKRHAARTASHLQTVEKSSPSRQNSSALLSFLAKKEVTPHDVEYYSVAAGNHVDHQIKNRYMDIVPYDRTRVVVHEGHPENDSERESRARYLNANWVLERYGCKWWIATQAPLERTAHAFLSVMLQPVVRPPGISTPSSGEPSLPKTTRVRTVIQLTRNVEGGRKKGDPYFPSEVGKSITVMPERGCYASALEVTLLETLQIKEAHCIQSIVSVVPLQPVLRNPQVHDGDDFGESERGQEIVFNHLLYLSWPDHGVPDTADRDSLIAFIRLADRTNRDTSRCPAHKDANADHVCSELDPDPPIMVGCSAGVGRTGSFIALSSLLREYGLLPPAARPTIPPGVSDSPLGPIPGDLKDDLILQEIDSLREQRPGMVQRTEQVRLVYDVLADMLSEKS